MDLFSPKFIIICIVYTPWIKSPAVCMCVCVEGGGDRSQRWWMAPPRLSDEQKSLSRQRRRDRRRELQRLRRADPEYRLAERARNTQARREQRNDPEYRKKERERDTRAHRERRNRVLDAAVMRNIAGSLWTNGNDYANWTPPKYIPKSTVQIRFIHSL